MSTIEGVTILELFKFCRHEHWLAMKGSGSARIGSLFDYRKTDKYGELTSDDSEYMKKPDGLISNLNTKNIRSYRGSEQLTYVKSGGEISQFNVKEYTASSPNFLIFSAFRIYCKETHRFLKNEEGYNSCYRIISARLFFRAISEALGPQYEFLGCGEVLYTDKMNMTSTLTGSHPALIKRQSVYTAPSEVRAVWRYKNLGTVEPRILDNSRARLYCCEHQHRYLFSKSKLN